ncbi:cell wall hydrolase [Tsuneonella mangrovi]|uniref:cell wall hydrolase n=1 Tax=Tsuneonella mangrovi TaxID=1982042 RepID=UPI000BA23DF9|nr:cell wall hydrolase [Tsuneonella mangrovi]
MTRPHDHRIPLEDGTAAKPYWTAVKRGFVPMAIALTPMAIVTLSLAQAIPTRTGASYGLVAAPPTHSRFRTVAGPAVPKPTDVELTATSDAGDPYAKGTSAAPGKLVAAVPYMFQGSASAREYAVSCLAAAAWYEGGSDAESQRSVIQVVINRMRRPAYPKTACGVIFQGSDRQTGCQFTFTCDGSLDRRHPSQKAWEAARLLAQAALDGAVDEEVAQATHFHADYVSPYWAANLVLLTSVGRHLFYRNPRAHERLVVQPIGGDADDRQFMTKIYDNAADQKVKGLAQIEPAQVADASIAQMPALQGVTVSGIIQAAGGGNTKSFVQAFDPGQPAGRWAVSALGRCGSIPGCSVFGYVSADQAAKNSLVPPGRRDRPAFLYANDVYSNAKLVLWDCSRFQRPSASQCLPVGVAAYHQLSNRLSD